MPAGRELTHVLAACPCHVRVMCLPTGFVLSVNISIDVRWHSSDVLACLPCVFSGLVSFVQELPPVLSLVLMINLFASVGWRARMTLFSGSAAEPFPRCLPSLT